LFSILEFWWLRQLFYLSVAQHSHPFFQFELFCHLIRAGARTSKVFFAPNFRLTNRLQQPVGYSADEAGFMGACFLLSGLVAAIVTAPLFDRVFTHHLAVTSKILVPFIAVGWFSFIWAGMPPAFHILNALL
jgi:hypothetical protein